VIRASSIAVVGVLLLFSVLGGCAEASDANITERHVAGAAKGLRWLESPASPVAPGANIRLSVETLSGFKPNANGVLFTCCDQTISDETAPYQAEFTIPVTARGTVTASALALDDGRVIAACDLLTIPIESSAQITEIILPSSRILIITIRPEKHITIKARFDDGVVRTIDPTYERLVLETSDPEIAEVDGSGLVTARAVGSTLLTVSNGEHTATATILVIEH